MLHLKDAIDEKTLKIIQMMFMKFLHSSTALYEADGTCVYSVFEGHYCKFLNETSCKGAASCGQDGVCSGKWICHEDCWRVSKESIDRCVPAERECSGGISIYAVPILYNEQVIGSINAGITNPPIEISKLRSVADTYGICDRELQQRAALFKRLTSEEIEIARLQLRMAALLISSIYEAKIKQIEAEKEVRLQKDQLETIIDNMSDGLSIFDQNGKYFMFNSAAKEMFFPSYQYMEKIGDGHYQAEYFDAKGNKLTSEAYPAIRVMNGEKFTGMRMMIKFPDKILHISVSGTPIYDENNNFITGVLCTRDISKVIKYERTIENNKSQLDAILENMVEGVVIANTKGDILMMNITALKIHGLSSIYEPEFLNQFAYNYELTTLDGNIIPIQEWPMTRALREEIVIDREVWLHNKVKKTKILCSYNGTPIYNKNGQMTMALVTIRDITQQKQQQQVLVKAIQEKNEALENSIRMKDEFLSIVSHEFKTPLTVINSAIQAMELICKHDLSDKAKSFINKIRQNSFRQLRLVNNLLDITRANAGRIKVNKKNLDIVFITKSIIESVYVYAENKGVKLSFTSSIQQKIMGIDEEKYERILLNLLSNAIKFTPSGRSIAVALRSGKNKVCVDVKDKGIGIPEAKQELIFERFGQVDSSLSRQAEGSGIGLSLVKMLVEAMGGSITLKSKEGQGSTFCILLPSDMVNETNTNDEYYEISNTRLIQATSIEFSDIYIDNGSKEKSSLISTNQKRLQDLIERELIAKTICSDLNNFSDLKLTLTSILSNLKELTGCEAVGIRLDEDGDYPYYVYKGFPDCFTRLENSLCERDIKGEKRLSEDGKHYILQCVCGKVIRGNVDSRQSFFTEKGSYWTNHASEIKTRPDIVDELGGLRGNCIANGYESTALVPIKSRGNIIGLIHLNDTRLNMFTIDVIEFLEMLGEQIGVAVENSIILKKLGQT